MDKKTKRKIGVIALILALIVCLYFIATTYSNYTSSISSSSTVEVAKWAVKIGGKDATTEDSFTLALSTDSSSYVSSGKIAPATTASGTFKIDPTGAEVAMSYEIEIDEDNIEYNKTNKPDTINIKSVSAVLYNSTGSVISKIDDETDYTTKNTSGVIGLKDVEAGNYLEFTVTVEWTSTNDEKDTTTGAEAAAVDSSEEAATVTVPIKVTASQYIG